MPVSTPEAIVPTILPRCWGAVSSLANGTRSCDNGGEANCAQCSQEKREIRRGRGPEEHDRGEAEDGGDQTTAVQAVPERNQEEDAQGVADLGCGDQGGGDRAGDGQRTGYLLNQWLGPIQVTDGEPARNRKCGCPGRAHAAGRKNRSNRHGDFHFTLVLKRAGMVPVAGEDSWDPR